MIQQVELGFMFHQVSAKEDGDDTCVTTNTISESASKPFSEVLLFIPHTGLNPGPFVRHH